MRSSCYSFPFASVVPACLHWNQSHPGDATITGDYHTPILTWRNLFLFGRVSRATLPAVLGESRWDRGTCFGSSLARRAHQPNAQITQPPTYTCRNTKETIFYSKYSGNSKNFTDHKGYSKYLEVMVVSPNCGVIMVKFGFERLWVFGWWKPVCPAISHFCGILGPRSSPKSGD